jgi:predicted peptidase
MHAKISLGLLALVFSFSTVAQAEQKPAPGKQVEQQFVDSKDKSLKIGYLLFLPKEVSQQKGKRPLILFLHGSGERGNDNLPLVAVHGPPMIAKKNADFPFVVVSPQCPSEQRWDSKVLLALLNDVIASHDVDPQRIYLTGLSMGGYGSWMLAAAAPNRFAAIVPICGGGNPEDAGKLKSLPIWVFHGAKDSAVSLKKSEEMVAALKKVGSDVKFTVYPNAGHNSWTATYDNPKLYEWLLKQKTASKSKE